MRIFTKTIAALLLLIISGGEVFSHGLTMTTAQVTQRHNNHITIKVETELTELTQRLHWQGKPVSLVHLANGNEQVLSDFRTELAKLFSERMPISFDGKPLLSANLRMPKIKQLKQQLQSEIANNVLNNMIPENSSSHSHGNNDRQNYLVVRVDGFMPTGIQQQMIEILFPAELGDILVSYSKPQVQTLSANNKAETKPSRYLQKLK